MYNNMLQYLVDCKPPSQTIVSRPHKSLIHIH